MLWGLSFVCRLLISIPGFHLDASSTQTLPKYPQESMG